jgi:NitT/TauT family transport system substrate-binding protein
MALIQNRRRFVAGLAAAGAAGIVRAPHARAAEGPLETTAIRLSKIANICIAPQLVPRSCCARRDSPISATTTRRPAR